MPPSDSLAPFIPLVGAVLALLCLIAGCRAGTRHRLIDNLPTSKTTGVFIGLVELKGTAESSGPLTSYLAGGVCVHYSWSIDERWSRTVVETDTDSDGKTRTRVRRESGWTNVAGGGETVPFFLQDDHGIVLVRPEGAKIEPVTVFRETCGPSEPLYYGKGPPGAVSDSDHVRRFDESAIPLHAAIYVMGQARERADVVAPEIAADKRAPIFLIELAALRTQAQATPPDVAGPDFQALKGTVIAIAERYPELKADTTFTNLHRNLVDTEQRVALARGYFNDIATHFNTRLETVPDRFVAGLAAMRPQALLQADEFERAPVKVDLTSGGPSPQPA